MTGITFTPIVPSFIVIAICALAAALMIYGLIKRARGVLLRALPIAALALAIADPQLIRESRAPLKDVAVVVVDDSDSQNLGRRNERTAAAAEKVAADLAAFNDVEVRTVRAGHGEGLTQDGTRLFGALNGVVGDIPAQRLAGTIFITDGQVHDAPTTTQAATSHSALMGAPVHVLLTGERGEDDRRLRLDRAPDFGLVGQSVMLTVKAEDTAAAPGTPVPVIIRRNGREVRQVAVPAGSSLNVPVQVETPGANVFELEAETRATELSELNNRTLVSVNGVRDRLRVLLISGQPHVGERAWRNLLKSDPNVDLVHFTILRPLTKDDNTPINELALIAFPIRELFEEQLHDFDLVIFDRYSRRGLVPFQFMSNVAEYVQRGGAVMLAVGPEYADPYSLFSSPLQSVLPAGPTGTITSEPFRPHLNAIGQRHPVTASLDGAADAEVPSWGRWLRQVQVAPTTGTPIMTGMGDDPLLILDRVGEGRVALLLSDTLWLWGKGFDGGGPQVELMRRLSHWLMKEPELEEESLGAELRDAALVVNRRSLETAERPVTVTLPSGAEQTVTPQDIGQGRFAARLPVTQPGLYKLSDGRTTTYAAVGSPNPRESYDVVATEERMKPLADATDGGVYWLGEGSAPAVRQIAPGRAAHGSSWMGLKANKQYVVTGATQTSLMPAVLALLLIMAGAMLAWWREGH